MAFVNENYTKLQGNYLFAEIAKRVEQYKKLNSDANVIRLGIGDVTKPLCPTIIKALHDAVDDMASESTFRGYGPYEGYEFLIDKIIKNDYKDIDIKPDEVFVSDGSKSDAGNIQELFSVNNIVAVQDPVYPVYVDSNVMAGRAGGVDRSGKFGHIVYLPCNAGNSFVPLLPSERVDIIYLCLPNNPTGTTFNMQQLKQWVDYAKQNKCVILFDAAYEAFIQQDDIPHSIYEVDGAKSVAIEFRSFSKTAGFTGTRCAYTIIPKELVLYCKNGEEICVNDLWMRRQSTKFNGVPYIVQRAAEAIYSKQGQQEIKSILNYYMTNANIIRTELENLGLKVFGGINAPYIWLTTPNNMSSWEFFDKLLYETNVVGTPGSGFGPSGEGYFRLTAFGSKEDVEIAMSRLKQNLRFD